MAKKTLKNKLLPLSLLGVFVSSTALGLAMQISFHGQIAPGTIALNTNISFKEAEQAQEEISFALEAYESTPVMVTFEEVSYEFSLDELGVNLDKTATVESIPVLNPINWLGSKEVTALFEVDAEIMEASLNEKIINLTVAPKEPSITWNAHTGDFDFTAEENGWAANLEAFQGELEGQIAMLESLPIAITTLEKEPAVTRAELETEKDLLTEKIATPTEIFTEEDYWEISWLDNQHLLDFIPVQASGNEAQVEIKIDQEVMTEHLAMYIAPEVEIVPEAVTILQDENNNISFEGTAVNGLSLDYETMLEMLNYALNNGLKRVEIPLITTEGEVNVPESLQELGITELVVIGYSSFYGSTYNRMHNIGVAIAKFDGVLIAPGETFSFGEQLGPVDGSTGYTKELVIKEGETIPEYGGGVCQVSSTLFRAILFGGFPIDERKAHSYAVSYYAYPLGWGLDATVYPPAVDLKFTNDSDTHLLIQTYTDGYLATFKFYGTKDGRAVAMDGPYISDRVGAPAAIYEVTPDLEAGVIDQVDSAHNGFTASWTREVTYPVGHPIYPDGYVKTEPIISPYVAWPAKYLVGEGTEGYE